ncbi:MAG: hypothetical protein AAB255_03095 [Bacteroidota bacterium]
MSRKIIFFALFIFGCSSQLPIEQICYEKISLHLFKEFQFNTKDDFAFSVIVTFKNIEIIESEYPKLRRVSDHKFVGDLQKDEIAKLCKDDKIFFIDADKTTYPIFSR